MRTPPPAPMRRPCRLPAALVLVWSVAACAPGDDAPAPGSGAPAEPAAATTSTLDADALADLLLERMALEPGERVVLVARPGRFDPLIERVREGVRAAGGEDLGVVPAGDPPPPAAWSTDFTARLDTLGDDALVDALRGVDLGVMMPGAQASPVYAGMQEVLRGGDGRTIHFHWGGAYGLDSRELPVTPEVDALYQRVLLETDYEALARTQRAFEEAMRGSTVRVTTPSGTDLSFRIGDRPVTKQDGDASAAAAAEARNLIDREVELPAGAVRVAPVEETVQGTIAFPPTEWIPGEPVEGLVMTFEDGVAVEVTADRGLESIRGVLERVGAPARSFRELAVGFNPLMPVQRDAETPWIPYYGYGDGVVRLSLGDNGELGGDVGGGWVRWNFFTDATVTVDGEPWVEDGRLAR